MRDNGHGNPENGGNGSSSNAESSFPVTTKTNTSMHVSTSSATSTSTGHGTSTAPVPHPQSSRKYSYTHDMTNDPKPNQNQNQSTKPNRPTTPNINENQFHLEQQIKMTQLHQLQQLQNHIFQQQMALISGQPTPITTVLPGSTSSELVDIRGVGVGVGPPIYGPGAAGDVVLPLHSLHNGEQNLAQLQSHVETQSGPHTFSGLPTPAPSGEIRPMDYNTTSPMMNLIGSLNLQHIEPLPNSMIPSSLRSPPQYPNLPHPNSKIPERYGHRHSSSLSLPSVHLQNNRQSHASYPSSPSTFNQTSPTFHPISPMHLPISHPYHRPSNSHHPSRTMPLQSQMQSPWNSHSSSSPPTPISTPSERIEFNIYGVDTNRNGGSLHATPHLHSSSSDHTSPSILGSGVGPINGPSGGRGFGQGQQLLDLDQDISPLTSPWLGATVSGSGGTAVSTSVQVASNPIGVLIQQKVEAFQAHGRRTSVSGNKRTASESGDEGDDAWSRGGTNRNSRKRPVLGSRGRTGSFSNAVTAPGMVSSEKEKGGEKDEGKNRGSTSPRMRNSTSPASEIVSSPTSLAKDYSPARENGSGGNNGRSSHSSTTPAGSSRRTRKGSRSTSTTSTPLLRSTPPSTNLLSPMSRTTSGRRESRTNLLGVQGGKGQGQGRERNSPSPVDSNLEVGQGQDVKNGRGMPPPPLPRGGGGVDVDVNSTEPTSSMDDSTGHLRDGMLGMGGMDFDSMMSLDDGMNVSMGMGMSGMGGMGLGLSGMDMESMGGIGSMGMEEMGVDMGMSMMEGFGNGHEDSHHLDMGYGRDHGDEGTHISSSPSSARTSAGMSLAAHQQQQSHLQSRPEYQTQHSKPLSHQSSHTPQMHELQTEQSQHPLQDQLGQSITGNLQQPIMPVATPSSILNLGRIGNGSGGRLGSASSSGVANAALNGDGTGVVPRVKKGTKAFKGAGGSNGASRKRSLTASVVGLGTGIGHSPALKPLRPAVAPSESTLPSPILTGSIGSSPSTSKAASSGVSGGTAAESTGGGSITTPILGPVDAVGVIRQPKRTHRDAEQRRRNSQKQVIDELRQLLPPIALPSDSNPMNNGDSEPTSPLGLPGTSPFFFQPTATLLPGGLPPRGPPKAGGEGPNKNVSKLQVLLCGNEYIKLLKARVERRDEEIGNLRREVRRLRGLRGGSMRGDEEMGVGVDLEKDLDSVEKLQMMNGKGAGASAGESSVQRRGSSMGSYSGPMEEDDDGDGDD